MSETELERAVEAFSDMIYRIAINILKNPSDAEDVMQESFYRLCRSEKTFASQEHLRNWLIRVTINESKKLRRSAWFRHTVPMDLQMPERETVCVDQDRAATWEAIQSLPEHYRTVVYLYYYEGVSAKDIAKILKKNPSTVQTWLMRARERLRKSLLGGEENDT